MAQAEGELVDSHFAFATLGEPLDCDSADRHRPLRLGVVALSFSMVPGQDRPDPPCGRAEGQAHSRLIAQAETAYCLAPEGPNARKTGDNPLAEHARHRGTLRKPGGDRSAVGQVDIRQGR